MIWVAMLIFNVAFIIWRLRHQQRPRVKPDAGHLRQEERRRQLLAESIARRHLSPD